MIILVSLCMFLCTCLVLAVSLKELPLISDTYDATDRYITLGCLFISGVPVAYFVFYGIFRVAGVFL